MCCVLIGQENGKSRLQRTQEEVEEVTTIMLDNMDKANERSVKLDDLENQADELFEKVTRFRGVIGTLLCFCAPVEVCRVIE